MKIDGEEVTAVECDSGVLCISCWLQKDMDDPDDNSINYYITNDQAMDFISDGYETCNECGCPLWGIMSLDMMNYGSNNEKNQFDNY